MRLTERPGRPAPPSVVERRQGVANAVASGLCRTDPPAQEVILGGVRVLRFLPPGPKRGTVLHFHGGGFRLGCPEMIGVFAAALAVRCNVEVVCPAYRLAPEHPFPAGLIDARAVLKELQAADSQPLIISGDSAGGGIAASLAALSVSEHAPASGVVLLSAWLDLTVKSRSYEDNAATDPLFSRASAEEAAELYLQGLSPKDPLASPLFGSVKGYPPTFISIGEGEVLADDGRHFYEALSAAGVKAAIHPVAGMEHVAVTRSLALTGAAETFESVAKFIDQLI